MERIAEGVYAIIHDVTGEQFPSGNTGVVIGDESVLVVDATYLPSHAKADIALIRSVTTKPVRYLVITHHHRDHSGGATEYADAFPGVAVVSGAATREFIAINRVAGAKAASENGVLARAERDELAAFRAITPDVAVAHELDLYLGKRHVHVQNRGRANSPDDVTVSLPAEGVLFSGDIVTQTPLPYTRATWPVEWSAVLRDIESERITAIMPGHGPVMRDIAYVRAMHALIDGVNSQVATFLGRGMTLDQIQQTVDVTRLRAGSPEWAAAALDDEWKSMTRALVERAWHELRGLD